MAAAHYCPPHADQQAFWDYQRTVMEPLRQAARDSAARDKFVLSEESLERAVVAAGASDGWNAADLDKILFGTTRTLRDDYRKHVRAIVAALNESDA